MADKTFKGLGRLPYETKIPHHFIEDPYPRTTALSDRGGVRFKDGHEMDGTPHFYIPPEECYPRDVKQRVFQLKDATGKPIGPKQYVPQMAWNTNYTIKKWSLYRKGQFRRFRFDWPAIKSIGILFGFSWGWICYAERTRGWTHVPCAQRPEALYHA